jgi:hypothetical protein
VLAYYRVDQVSIAGEAKAYERVSDVGNKVETFFCPVCDSTVYLKLAKQPALLGVALGSIADPTLSAPSWSVWKQSKHHWIDIPGEVQHIPQGQKLVPTSPSQLGRLRLSHPPFPVGNQFGTFSKVGVGR